MGASAKPHRIVDPKAIEAARLPFCTVCGQATCNPTPEISHWQWNQVAHGKSKGSGGDDVPENLFSCCLWCHGKSHQGTLKLARNYTLANPPKWFVGSDAA